MAQRNSPSRRVPDSPVAGLLRTLSYQARYANRRRRDVPTVTSITGQLATAQAEAAASGGAMPEPPPPEEPEAAAQRAATADASAATLVMSKDGSATFAYEDRGSVPVVTATVVSTGPALATLSYVGPDAATVTVWNVETGSVIPGATAHVSADWP